MSVGVSCARSFPQLIHGRRKPASGGGDYVVAECLIPLLQEQLATHRDLSDLRTARYDTADDHTLRKNNTIRTFIEHASWFLAGCFDLLIKQHSAGPTMS